MMPMPELPDFADFFDSLIEGLGDAVTDVRHSLVEEGWFGRQVTDGIERDSSREGAMEDFYGSPAELDDFQWPPETREPADKEREIEPPDHGIDR